VCVIDGDLVLVSPVVAKWGIPLSNSFCDGGRAGRLFLDENGLDVAIVTA
jgi:hypothetical protein